MMYVVQGVFEDHVETGDIATSKSHAARWAKKNQQIYGGVWSAVPAPDGAITMAEYLSEISKA